MTKYQYFTAGQGRMTAECRDTGRIVAGAANITKPRPGWHIGWNLYLVQPDGFGYLVMSAPIKANRIIHDHAALDAAIDGLLDAQPTTTP